MIRSRAFQRRGNLHICPHCRPLFHFFRSQPSNRLVETSYVRHDVSIPKAASGTVKTIHSSTASLNAKKDSQSTSTGNSPGGFPGGFAAGSFGAFANKASPTAQGHQKKTTLLPHERAALDAQQPAKHTNHHRPPAGQHRRDADPKRQNAQAKKRPNASIADMLRPSKRGSNAQPSSQTAQNVFDSASAAELKGRTQRDNRGTPGSRARNDPRHSSWSGKDQNGSLAGLSKPRVKKGKDASLAWQQFKPTSGKGQSESANLQGTDDFWAQLEKRADARASSTASSRFATNAARNKERASKATSHHTHKSQEATQSPEQTVASPSAKRQDSALTVRSSRFESFDDEEGEVHKGRSKGKKHRGDRRVQRDYHEEEDDPRDRSARRKQKKADQDEWRTQQAAGKRAAIPIFIPEYISASSLSTALRQNPDRFLDDMLAMGFENVTSDTLMTGETAALIAMEYGYDPTVDDGAKRDLRSRPVPEDASELPQRPPVVTIMGHVDHGKTTLLDYLRKSSIAAQEHGGITQHIGAFVVKMSSGKAITFLDTPGHSAFETMRQRGAIVTDIVVLVVAADDSVKPQTIEALKHARGAKVPIIVAINKIDKEDARIDQVKSDLVRHGVEIEDYGGDVQVVLVSGKTGKGMDDLEENIVTLSEILDVRAEDDGMAEGWILESSVKIDGKAATVLVKRGTLRTGDFIVAGRSMARVRLLRNEAGVDVSEAPPGTPVEVLGWRDLPEAGQQILQAPNEEAAKTAVEYRQEMAERQESGRQQAEQERKQREKAAEDAVSSALEDSEGVGDAGSKSAEPGIIYQNFVVRADVAGSVEAVCGSLLELGNHEVQSKVLRSSAGQISEYDVDHAATSNSILVNFNNSINPHIKQRADEAKVRIMDYNVIYHLADEAKNVLSNLLPPLKVTRVLGEADILQIFPINIKGKKFKNIAGCRVRNGSIKKNAKFRVLRKGQTVYEGSIDTLKHVKKDVQEMGKGTECGVGFEKYEGFEVDDQLQCFETVEEKRSL